MDFVRQLHEIARQHAERAAASAAVSQPIVMWVAQVSPLRVTDGLGPSVPAKHYAGYTPVAGDRVEVQVVGRALHVRDKVPF